MTGQSKVRSRCRNESLQMKEFVQHREFEIARCARSRARKRDGVTWRSARRRSLQIHNTQLAGKRRWPGCASAPIELASIIVHGKKLGGIGGNSCRNGVRGYVSAYDMNSGKLVWRFYTVPGDPAIGFESPAQHMILADLTIGGRRRRVLMQAPKNGFFYVLDRATGELISASLCMDVNWASGVDIKAGRPVETGIARYAKPEFSGAARWVEYRCGFRNSARNSRQLDKTINRVSAGVRSGHAEAALASFVCQHVERRDTQYCRQPRFPGTADGRANANCVLGDRRRNPAGIGHVCATMFCVPRHGRHKFRNDSRSSILVSAYV